MLLGPEVTKAFTMLEKSGKLVFTSEMLVILLRQTFWS